MIEDDDPYVYPGTKTLRNRFGIADSDVLDFIERHLVIERISQGVPGGLFDLVHLRAIHRHLFQDIYDWAGELRTVEINKGGHQFQFRRYIQTGMADVHRRVQSGFLRDLSSDEFARQAGVVMGDVNYVHPFREGNGRTQAQYLKQLAAQAGHDLDPGGSIDLSGSRRQRQATERTTPSWQASSGGQSRAPSNLDLLHAVSPPRADAGRAPGS